MEKIKATHLSRLAIVYLRQSTLTQVERNRESTTLQYSRLERAEAIVWRKSQTKALNSSYLPGLQAIENLIKSSPESALEKMLVSSFLNQGRNQWKKLKPAT